MKPVSKIIAIVVCLMGIAAIGCSANGIQSDPSNNGANFQSILDNSSNLASISDSSNNASTNPEDAKHYTAEEIKAHDITIEKSGCSFVEVPVKGSNGSESASPGFNFAFIAKNPNAGYVAENVPFNVTGYNAAGETVFSGGTTCMYMYPGIDTAMSGTVKLDNAKLSDTKVTRLEVIPLLTTVEYMKTDLTDSQLNNMFTVSNEKAKPDGRDVTIEAWVTGDLADSDMIFKVANLDDTLEGHAIVVLTNEAGEIVYGSESTNVLIDQSTLNLASDINRSDSDMNLSVNMPNVPTYANYTIYVMPGL